MNIFSMHTMKISSQKANVTIVDSFIKITILSWRLVSIFCASSKDQDRNALLYFVYLISVLKSDEPKFLTKRKAEIERQANLEFFDQHDDMNEDQNVTDNSIEIDYVINDDDDFTNSQITSKPKKPLIRISITGHVRTIEVEGKGMYISETNLANHL